MSLTVTIIFDDNTLIDAGVNLQLLRGGNVVATALSGSNGTVTFDVDPSHADRPRRQSFVAADTAVRQRRHRHRIDGACWRRLAAWKS